MPRVYVTKGATYFKEYALCGAEIVTIGRARTNDIVLPDPSVSRYHAAIVPASKAGLQYFIRDLSSVRLTKLRGEAIHQRILRDGDRLQIADYELQYMDQTSPPRQSSFIRLVPKRSETTPGGSTTVIAIRSELQKGVPTSLERRELVEDIVQRATTLTSLDALLETIVPPLLRVLDAHRGFAALLGGRGADLDFVAASGMDANEQIEICDDSYMARILQGCCVLEGNTMLAPIRSRGKIAGFYCINRNGYAEPFSEDDAQFLLALTTMVNLQLGRAPRIQPPPQTPDQILEWPIEIVGRSEKMKVLSRQIEESAADDGNVLITGETGSGKELVARAIHARSPRSGGPFIAKSCAELPETLAESLLFGYAKKVGIAGAAPEGAPGWFELASKGTLLLDEIQALSPTVQEKFLRVLQDKEVWRMGAQHPARIDLKVLAATDRTLDQLLDEGVLRRPLYHRFGRKIHIPPLQERKEDIPLLVHYFLDKLASERRTKARWISHRTLQRLLNYDWLGSVRELEHTIENAASSNREILFSWDFDLQHYHARAAAARDPSGGIREQESTVFPERDLQVVVRNIQDVEKEKIMEALESTLGNVTKAAELLGYSRNTILNKMDRYGVARNYGDSQTIK